MSRVRGHSEGAPQPLELPSGCPDDGSQIPVSQGLDMVAILVYGPSVPPRVPPSLHGARGSPCTERSWGPAEPDLDILSRDPLGVSGWS